MPSTPTRTSFTVGSGGEKPSVVSRKKSSSSSNFITDNLLLVLVAYRLVNALTVRTFFQPDEYYQSLEPAWWLAFGDNSGAWMTWVRAIPLSANQTTDGDPGMEEPPSIGPSTSTLCSRLPSRQCRLSCTASRTLCTSITSASCAEDCTSSHCCNGRLLHGPALIPHLRPKFIPCLVHTVVNLRKRLELVRLYQDI